MENTNTNPAPVVNEPVVAPASQEGAPEGAPEQSLSELKADALEGLDVAPEEVPGEEVPAAEEDAPAEEAPEAPESKSKVYAKLQEAESKALQYKQEVEKLQNYYKDMPTPEQLAAYAKENPAEFLNYFYGSPEEAASALMTLFGAESADEPLDESTVKLRELEAKVAAQEQALAARAQREQQSQMRAQLDHVFNDISSIITADSTPILDSMRDGNALMPNGAADYVFQKTFELFQETGQQYPFNEVAAAVETMLASDLGKVAPVIAPPAPAAPAPVAPPTLSPTLSNRGASSSSPGAVTLQELREQALKDLQ